MDCARTRISWFWSKKIWRHDLLDSLAPAMNSFKKWCPWCDFSVVMWLEFFVAPATRDVTAAPWCDLSRVLVVRIKFFIWTSHAFFFWMHMICIMYSIVGIILYSTAHMVYHGLSICSLRGRVVYPSDWSGMWMYVTYHKTSVHVSTRRYK